MPRDFIRRYLPSPAAVREHRMLRPLGSLLHTPEIWALNRHSVAGAVFIGLFCAFLPFPGQTLFAGVAAVVSRCNLPVSLVFVWVTNPITIPPVFYFAYRLGAWLLDRPTEATGFEFALDGWPDQLAVIWEPLILGSLLCGWVAGISGFVIVRLLWRLHVVRRWRARRARRAIS